MVAWSVDTGCCCSALVALQRHPGVGWDLVVAWAEVGREEEERLMEARELAGLVEEDARAGEERREEEHEEAREDAAALGRLGP